MRRSYNSLIAAGLLAAMFAPYSVYAQNVDETPDLPAPSRFGQAEIDQAYGAFQRGLYITARNLALPRAEAGDPAAMTLLAEIHMRGLGVPIDLALAEDYYRQAASKGITEAEFRYGVMLLQDAETRDDKKAAADYIKRAADKGHASAQFNYGQLVRTLRPGASGSAAAVRYFRQAAEAGIPDAQFLLGRFYLDGSLNIDDDLAQARIWFERAARQNFTEAQVEYGVLLVDGVGGPQDVARGFGWVLQAARAGSVQGQLIVSQLYRSGIGTEPDNIEAAAWYILARRADQRVPVMEDFWLGLSDEQHREAIVRANALF